MFLAQRPGQDAAVSARVHHEAGRHLGPFAVGCGDGAEVRRSVGHVLALQNRYLVRFVCERHAPHQAQARWPRAVNDVSHHRLQA